MASRLYLKAKGHFLRGELSWTDDPVMALMIDGRRYRPDFRREEFLGDIPMIARVGIGMKLIGRTVVLNAADAEDIVFETVAGDSISAILFYVDARDNLLIGFVDQVVGLPTVSKGTDLRIEWDNGAARIFEI